MGYLPTGEADLIVWFNDHAVGVTTHGATVGLTAPEITQATEDATTVSNAINGRSLYSSKSQEFTAYKDILLYAPINTPLPSVPSAPTVALLGLGALAACVPRARARSEKIKAHQNYTVAIGEDCRIVAPATDPVATQPTLKAVAETSFAVKLTFAMYDHDQIEIQSQVATESTWTSIAFDTNSPYLDSRAPQTPDTPEQRRYQARYRDDDAPFGTWSDTVTVTAQA